MKCKHCGGDEFVGHQIVRMDVLVDGSGDYIDGIHKDISYDIYDAEPAYGPFQCCRCGAEYVVLSDGQDSIDGPVEGWTWYGERHNEAAETKIIAKPWEPQDLLDDLQQMIDEQPDTYTNRDRSTLCMAKGYLELYFRNGIEDLVKQYVSSCKEYNEHNNSVLPALGCYSRAANAGNDLLRAILDAYGYADALVIM